MAPGDTPESALANRSRACIVDYFPKKRVPGVRAALTWILRGFTLLVAYGLYEFESNDVGVTEAVKRVWTAKA